MYFYDMVRIRPPSEAESLLLPLTIGCSHNKCTFCCRFKDQRFTIRPIEEVKADIDFVSKNYRHYFRRVFIENADALITPQPKLVEVLEYIREKLPEIERVGIYGNCKSILRKSPEDLKELKRLGLGIIYMGVESGDEEILRRVKKGVNPSQLVEAGRRVKEAGITLSVTFILGLGGKERTKEHAHATARLLTEIDPDFVGALTLMLERPAPIVDEVLSGAFKLISPLETLIELRTVIAESEFTNCLFTSNHASNYLPLRIKLPEQKREAMEFLDLVIAHPEKHPLKPEFLRAL